MCQLYFKQQLLLSRASLVASSQAMPPVDSNLLNDDSSVAASASESEGAEEEDAPAPAAVEACKVCSVSSEDLDSPLLISS